MVEEVADPVNLRLFYPLVAAVRAGGQNIVGAGPGEIVGVLGEAGGHGEQVAHPHFFHILTGPGQQVVGEEVHHPVVQVQEALFHREARRQPGEGLAGGKHGVGLFRRIGSPPGLRGHLSVVQHHEGVHTHLRPGQKLIQLHQLIRVQSGLPGGDPLEIMIQFRCLLTLVKLLVLGAALPDVEDERCGNDRVAQSHAEVAADHGAAEQLLRGQRTDCVEQVEQDCSQNGLADGGPLDRGSADEDGGDAEGAHLLVAVVGVHSAQILIEDNLSPGGQHRGDDDRDDPHLVDLDAGGPCHLAVVAHGAHVLSQLGFHKFLHEEAHQCDEQEGGDWDADQGLGHHKPGHFGHNCRGRSQYAAHRQLNSQLFGELPMNQSANQEYRRKEQTEEDDAGKQVYPGVQAEDGQAV